MAKPTHGMFGTPTYRAWDSMHTRCRNPNADSFPDYGGRGVKVCDRWGKFENFLADMGVKPDDLSLDRIDVNGDYEPNNCRWATASEQCRNRRNTVHLTFMGRTQTSADWADELGLPKHVVIARLRLGWSVERTLTEAVHFRRGSPRRRAA